jgi:hypothetical protein
MPLWTNTTSDLYRENYDKIFRKGSISVSKNLNIINNSETVGDQYEKMFDLQDTEEPR